MPSYLKPILGLLIGTAERAPYMATSGTGTDGSSKPRGPRTKKRYLDKKSEGDSNFKKKFKRKKESC